MGQIADQGAARVIWLHKAAPNKPAEGLPCNGCGVCCATEPCPVALVFLFQRRGACKALLWNGDGNVYRCGMAQNPERYLRYLRRLPAWAVRIAQRLVLRWIAAGTACDASDETEEP